LITSVSCGTAIPFTDAINFLDARPCIFVVLTPEKITRLRAQQRLNQSCAGAVV
jgi:hypothetical protein